MTIEELSQLSDDELRVKVAEKMGWKLERIEEHDAWDVIQPSGLPYANLYAKRVDAICNLPPFSTSLDAIHEAEKTIYPNSKASDDYVQALRLVMELPAAFWDSDRTKFLFATATARQRAIAFLLV